MIQTTEQIYPPWITDLISGAERCKQTPTSHQLISFPVPPIQNSKWRLFLPFHNSNDDEFVLTSFWLNHYLLSQLLFLRHSVFDLQPSANRRWGGGVGRSRWPMGGACRLWFSAPWTAAPSPASGLRGGDSETERFFKKIVKLQIQESTAACCSPCFAARLSPPWCSCGFFFFSDPSVESSRVLTALFLRLQVDFYPLLVCSCFQKTACCESAEWTDSFGKKKSRLNSQIMSRRRIAL